MSSHSISSHLISTNPIHLISFCSSHSSVFLRYVLTAYFVHHAKLGLFVSTLDTFYIFFFKDPFYFIVYAWRVKPYSPHDAVKPLHLKKTVSSSLLLETVLELLLGLEEFQMSALLVTPLSEIAVLPHVKIALQTVSVTNLRFDTSIPAFVLPQDQFIPVDILSAPFVMLLNGSTTPDPRLYNSGTSSLWSTMTQSKYSLHKLRYGLFLQQIKTPSLFKSVYTSYNEREDSNGQFVCDL